MPGEPRSSSGRNLPNSSSTYASVEGASTPTSSREHFGDPPAASVFTAGSDPGDQEMSGSVSDLTELPTEFDSSPQAPSEIPSKSVVMKPSSPSVVLPISLSPHHKPRRRVFMECVEIPRPAWYRKRAQCMPETQPVVPRRRKLSQSDSWHPSLQKRTRSLTVVPDSSSTDTLANALNKTFKYNSSTRGHDEGTFNDSEIKHEKERRYRDIGVETRPRFTKLPPTVTAREQDDTIAKLQGEKSELEMALQAVHRELEIYRQRDEAWALASQMKPSFVPPPAHSISQAISHLPSRPASQFTTRSRPPVASSDALLTSLDIDQEPLLPPIETIPPSMPTSLASSSKREPTAVSQQPRKHTPTEPRSYRLQAAVTPPPKRGNAQHVKARQHALCERSFLGREPSRAHRRKAPTATIPQPDLRQHRAEDATEEAPPPSLSYSAASQINGTVDRGAWTP
ncbi:hypothetical protein F5I97DRAFT_526729 [Phlebopus sp. FC_14]|nr:hypothetical protein F5I97DRAFT_526729 [Phlebopus sp. FC_14]